MTIDPEEIGSTHSSLEAFAFEECDVEADDAFGALFATLLKDPINKIRYF